jgi:hypothetical protein
MKHIKRIGYFDKYIKKYAYVILVSETKDSKKFGYKVGDLCYIIDVDNNTNIYPYQIMNITNDECKILWVLHDQIRKAEKWELDQNKYNL